MTVQQDHPTTTAVTPVPVPAPRQAAHDAAPPPVPREHMGWTSPEERLMCRLMVVMMLALGLFASLMTWVSARVW